MTSHGLHLRTPTAGCGICRVLADIELRNHYGSIRAFTLPRADAVADAMGFCAPHATMLAKATDNSPSLPTLLVAAAGKIVELLRDRFRSQERLTNLLFEAAAACPICHLIDHQLPRQLRGVLLSMSQPEPRGMGSLCMSHFRALIAIAPHAMLKDLAECQIASLRGVGVATNTRIDAHFAGGQVASDAPTPRANIDEFLCDDRVCPVCRTVSTALDEWIAALRDAAHLGAHEWIAFPTCDSHISLCAHVCPDETARRIVAYASTLLSNQLDDGVLSNERADREYEHSRDSVWFRRKSPAYLLGQRRKALLRGPRCPGCERLALARDRAITGMLRLLREASVRRAFSTSNGLCIKHFARAFLVAPDDEMRDFLASAQIARLSELQRDLDHLGENAADSGATTSQEDRNKFRRAIYRLAAFV